jgi:endonuclease/exonuclease/phosphatase family metal-dependent hydrolase
VNEPRDSQWSVPKLALGTLVLVDVLRVWLPSIITIFGQAASTPAELMGGFALLWFLLPFAVVPVWGRLPRRAKVTLVGVAAVGLGGSRLALLFVHGGQPQLYVASAGLLCGLVWFAAQAMGGSRPVPGVPAGLVVAGVQHLVLGTVDLTWTGTWWAVVIVGVEVVLFLMRGVRRPVDGDDVSTGWSLMGPTLLLAGMVLLSPAALLAEVSYVTGDLPGGISGNGIAEPVSAWLWLLFVIPVVAFYRGAIRLTDILPWQTLAHGVALVLAVALYMYLPTHGYGSFRFLAIWLGAWSLGRCLSFVGYGVTRGPARAGTTMLAGMLGFAVAAVVYYAAYDIGYPNRWVPVVVAVYVAGSAVAMFSQHDVIGQRDLGWSVVVVPLVVPALLYLAGPVPAPVEKPDAGTVRLVAYNIRMGFGLDGTFDPEAAARAVRREKPDVVVMSEVDRAWLLNGGHDTLAILARKLGMRYYFAPAADPVWGDAVLTNLPVAARETVRLTADGAPTGAQALGVVLRVGGREIAVVSTHIQPPPGRAPLVQVREISAFATRFGGDRPTVVAGDLNISPGDPSMRAFADAGYGDALAAFRPLPTFPADRPTKEIDHVLVRGGLTASEPSVGTTTASDHAPVAVTLRW